MVKGIQKLKCKSTPAWPASLFIIQHCRKVRKYPLPEITLKYFPILQHETLIVESEKRDRYLSWSDTQYY